MNIAYCILTFNHSDTLLKASMRYFEFFQKKGIDIYIYDSSTDTKTHSLYLAWKYKGLDNIYYVDCHHILSGDAKYYQIMHGFGLEKQYDYIWPIKDRMFVSETHLDSLLNALSNHPDVVLAAYKNVTFTYEVPHMPEEFSEPVNFFKYYGATSTSWDCIIFNYHSMLKNIDWEVYDSLYGINEHCPFIQPCTLFARLSELNSCNIKIVRPEPNGRLALKGASSGWVKSTVDIWGHKWPSAIRKLPAIYDKEKPFVIKSQCMNPIVFGSIDHLLYLSENEWFTKEMFNEIKDDFINLSDIPVSYIEMLFNKEYKSLFQHIFDDFLIAFQNKEFFKAMWLHNTAPQLKYYMGESTYNQLDEMFKTYQLEMMNNYVSSIFDNVIIT